MKDGVKVGHVVGTAVAALIAVYLLLRFWSSRGNPIPEISWFTVAVIVLIGALVLAGGWQIRSYRQHKVTRMPSPQLARRTVVSAQASALVGGALAGWYGGHVGVALGNLDSDRLREIALVGTVAALASAGLAAVGLVVQSWCRIDDDEDENRPKNGDPTPA